MFLSHCSLHLQRNLTGKQLCHLPCRKQLSTVNSLTQYCGQFSIMYKKNQPPRENPGGFWIKFTFFSYFIRLLKHMKALLIFRINGKSPEIPDSIL